VDEEAGGGSVERNLGLPCGSRGCHSWTVAAIGACVA
jgi:hypothetical protein